MKLFVTDYDGTLYTDDKSMKKNIRALKKLRKNDFLIVISTGRSYVSIKNQIEMYNIPYDYVSCADGSITYDKSGKIVQMFSLDKKIIDAFQRFYENLSYEEIQFSYPAGYENNLREDDHLLGINVCISSHLYTKELVKEFYNLKKIFPKYNYLAYEHPNYSYLCIKPKDISKSYSLKELQKELQINSKDIYVIGDSSNDYEMIKEFKGVCMTNSYPDIIQLSKKRYIDVYEYIDEILKDC